MSTFDYDDDVRRDETDIGLGLTPDREPETAARSEQLRRAFVAKALADIGEGS